MADDVGVLSPRRQRRRRPELPCLLVTDVDGLAAGVGDGIVIPWREAVLMAVLGPRVAATSLRDDGAKLRIGKDVDPWGRRRLSGGQPCHILPAIVAETTQTVEVGDIPLRHGVGCFGIGQPAGRLQQRNHKVWSTSPLGLFGQRPSVVVQDDAGHRLQQRPVFLRHLFAAANEDATAFVDQRGFGATRDQIDDGFLQRLPVDGIVFIPDHEIDNQPLQPPIRMRLHRVAYEADLFVVTNPYEHDRHIA